MLLPSPSSMRAAATTPAEPADARVARFPAGGSLPRQKGGSASALLVSGPAQRSLALQPAWSLSRPRRPRYIGVLQAMSLPPSPAPIATGWSDSCRAGFAPARRRRLSTAHRPICASSSAAPIRYSKRSQGLWSRSGSRSVASRFSPNASKIFGYDRQAGTNAPSVRSKTTVTQGPQWLQPKKKPNHRSSEGMTSKSPSPSISKIHSDRPAQSGVTSKTPRDSRNIQRPSPKRAIPPNEYFTTKSGAPSSSAHCPLGF